ncbi:hypothetical protein PAXY110619_19125 [Paenibacillus xylanexedens]|uniref:Uncharacterized protein n=1 Tax=Paenibacillus xylanexedens TaxID=528191 RepID=A0ABS4RN72_PAEXY|nr:hypothetical protein [Paenibacillus xylanexedens]
MIQNDMRFLELAIGERAAVKRKMLKEWNVRLGIINTAWDEKFI